MPTLLQRTKALTIDTLLLIFLMYTFAILSYITGIITSCQRMCFLALLVLYEPVCNAFGCTLGRYVMHIRVRRFATPAKRINILQSLVRSFLKLVLGYFSYLSIFKSKTNRAIHDYAAGSVTISV